MFEAVFTHVWWRYDRASSDWFSHLYHWFNLLEGCVWLVVAGLILRRFLEHRRSRLEIVYAVAFTMFALTDFQESLEQSSWLIWGKLMNLVVLYLLRKRIMSKYYPSARVY